MHREQRGDACASPDGTRHPFQNGKEQNRIEAVKDQIDKKVAPGIESEQLVIDHVRDPGKRMPVIVIICRKGPRNTLEGESMFDVGIVNYYFRIVEIDECVVL